MSHFLSDLTQPLVGVLISNVAISKNMKQVFVLVYVYVFAMYIHISVCVYLILEIN